MNIFLYNEVLTLNANINNKIGALHVHCIFKLQWSAIIPIQRDDIFSIKWFEP